MSTCSALVIMFDLVRPPAQAPRDPLAGPRMQVATSRGAKRGRGTLASRVGGGSVHAASRRESSRVPSGYRTLRSKYLLTMCRLFPDALASHLPKLDDPFEGGKKVPTVDG